MSLVLRWGRFELDEARFELRKTGSVVPLQRRVLEFLLYLAKHRTRVVTKDELLDRVWRNIVSEASISQAVSLARRALDDTPEAQHTLRTVHGKGFQFVAAAQAIEASAAGTGPSGTPTPVRQARHAAFVGRTRELSSLRTALVDQGGECLLAWVHGAAGVGKTTLLAELVQESAGWGVEPVLLRSETLPTFPDLFLEGFCRAIGWSDGLPRADDPGCAKAPTKLVLIDDYHLLSDLDEWVRTVFWPSLPSNIRLVLSSRARPPVRWRADSAWARTASTVRLEPFDEAVTAQFLEVHRVPSHHQRAIWEFTRGNPLALALAVDALRCSDEAREFGPEARADVIDSLVEWVAEQLPDARQVDALEAACLAPAVNRALLGAILGDGHGGPAFRWLSQLAFIDASADRDSIEVHALVREGVLSRLGQRDPQRLLTLIGRAFEYLVSEIQHAPDTQTRLRLSALMMSMGKHHPALHDFYHDEESQHMRMEHVAPGPAPWLCEIVEAHEGAESARIARRWLEHRACHVWVARGSEGVPEGFVMQLKLTVDDRDAGRHDPVVAHLFDFLDQGRLRPDDRILVHRYIIARKDYQQPCAVLQRCHQLLHQAHHYYPPREPNLVHSFIVYAAPDSWAPIMQFSGCQPVVDVRPEIGRRRFNLYYLSYRETPFDEWVTGVARRLVMAGTQRPPEEHEALG